MIDHTLIRRHIAAVYDLSVKSAQVEMVGEELARLQLAINSDPLGFDNPRRRHYFPPTS